MITEVNELVEMMRVVSEEQKLSVFSDVLRALETRFMEDLPQSIVHQTDLPPFLFSSEQPPMGPPASQKQPAPAKASDDKHGKGSKAAQAAASQTVGDAASKVAAAPAAAPKPSDASSAPGVDLRDLQPFGSFNDDFSHISIMGTKMESLSFATLKKMTEVWGICKPSGKGVMKLNSLIMLTCEKIRQLAAFQIARLSEKHSLSDGDPDLRASIVDTLAISLCSTMAQIKPQLRRQLCTVLQIPASETVEYLCSCVTALGIRAFFSPLKLSTLKQIADEMKLPAMKADMDEEVMADAIVRAIYLHVYPTVTNFSFACCPRVAVHELGSKTGNFICTIENASMLMSVPIQRQVSNAFMFNQSRCYVVLDVDHKDMLSFLISNKSKNAVKCAVDVKCHTAEIKFNKKRKKTVPATIQKSATLTLSEEPSGFNELCPVSSLFHNEGVKLSEGTAAYLTWVKSSDLIKVNFSMSLDAADGGKPVAADAGAHQQPGKKGKKGGAGGSASGTPSNEAMAQMLLEEEEMEKKQKSLSKLRQKLEKKAKQVEAEESQTRDQIISQSHATFTDIAKEVQKSYQRCFQRTRDRERKAELARSSPSADLVRQLKDAQTQHQQAKSSLHKAQVDLENAKKEVASIESARAEPEATHAALTAAMAENVRRLHEMEEELRAAIEERDQKQEAADAAVAAQRAAAPLALGVGFGDPMGRAASITDFQAFWSSPSTPNMGGGDPTPPGGSGSFGGTNSWRMMS